MTTVPTDLYWICECPMPIPARANFCQRCGAVFMRSGMYANRPTYNSDEIDALVDLYRAAHDGKTYVEDLVAAEEIELRRALAYFDALVRLGKIDCRYVIGVPYHRRS